MNEATARIKINRLLEKSGWRFFPEGDRSANIRLEQHVAVKKTDLDALGDDFEKTQRGFVDFLLLDSRGFPLVVLEAKSEAPQPADGQGAGQKVRQIPELPIRHPLKWQPPLLLGPRTRQPTHNQHVSVSRLGRGVRQGQAQPAPAHQRARGRRLHRPDPEARIRLGSRLEERGRAAGVHTDERSQVPAGLPD